MLLTNQGLSIGQIVLSRVTYDPIKITKIFEWGIKGVLLNWVADEQPFHLRCTDGVCFLRLQNIIVE